MAEEFGFYSIDLTELERLDNLIWEDLAEGDKIREVAAQTTMKSD